MLKASRMCLSSYKGLPHGLKASDARLEFETGQRYFDSFLFKLRSPNAACKNCGRSDNVNCPRGGNHEKSNDHENFNTKIYIHVILAISRKFLTTKIWSYTVPLDTYIHRYSEFTICYSCIWDKLRLAPNYLLL